ncbi:hypothetical protein B484DRAFT_470466, partial [Ochromonadaceae sp. CCMP2298]
MRVKGDFEDWLGGAGVAHVSVTDTTPVIPDTAGLDTGTHASSGTGRSSQVADTEAAGATVGTGGAADIPRLTDSDSEGDSEGESDSEDASLEDIRSLRYVDDAFATAAFVPEPAEMTECFTPTAVAPVAATLGNEVRGATPVLGTSSCEHGTDGHVCFDSGYADGYRPAADRACPVIEQCLAILAQKKEEIMDSGCTSHTSRAVVNDLTDFVEGVEYMSLGNAKYRVKSEGRGVRGMLKNVMWTPEMSYSMVNVPCLDLSGQLVVFGRSRCRVLIADVCDELLAIVDALPAHETLMTATLNGKLYHVDDTEREVSAATVGGTVRKARHVHSVGFERTPSTAREHPAVAATPVPYVFGKDSAAIKGSKGTVRPGSTAGLNPLQLLHIRSGHASKAVLLAGLKVNAFRGAQTTYQACAKLEIGPCDSCLRGSEQQGTITHSSRDFDALAPMQEVGMDPVRLSTPTIHREEYFNFGLCYGTRLAMGDPAKGEGKQVDMLKGIQRKWCTPFSHKIGTLHTDYASIFRSGEMQKHGHVTRGAANIGERALAVTEACNAAVDDWADPALEQAM